jgi:hypothetical protein
MKYDYSEFSDEAFRTTTTELRKIEFGPKNIPFALDQEDAYQKPGVTLIDRTLPESRQRPDHEVVYTVAANGKQLLLAAQSKIQEIHHAPYMLYILGVLALSPLAFILSRYMKGKR